MKRNDQYLEISLPVLKLPKLLYKVVPLWLVLFLLFDSALATGVIQYFIMKRNFNASLNALAKTTKKPEELVQILKQEVIPQSGYTLAVRWNDIGKQLLESGVIDKTKYNELFKDDKQLQKYMSYLNKSSNDHMVINEINSRFMVNTLWALGLVNKSNILDDGEMQKNGNGDAMVYASTGGWSLGTKQTSELYSSASLISLTPQQEELVKKIAQNVYRPCCNNSTYFPDCNHGMAALGYIQLAIKQGVPEKRIYQDILALNSYWFPQTYIEQAAYFQQQKTEWKNVDPKKALSAEFSSGTGAQRIKQAVQNLPGVSSQGGGCSA